MLNEILVFLRPNLIFSVSCLCMYLPIFAFRGQHNIRNPTVNNDKLNEQKTKTAGEMTEEVTTK